MAARSLLTIPLTYAGLLLAVQRIAKRQGKTPEDLIDNSGLAPITKGRLHKDGRRLRGLKISPIALNNALRKWNHHIELVGDDQAKVFRTRNVRHSEPAIAHALETLNIQLSPAATEILRGDATRRKETVEEAASKILEAQILNPQ